MLSAFLFNIAQKPLFPIIEWIAGSVLKSPFFKDTAVSGRYRRVHFYLLYRGIAMGYSSSSSFQDKIKGFNERFVMVLIRHVERYLTKIGIDMGLDDKVIYNVTVQSGQAIIATDNATVTATNQVGVDIGELKKLIADVQSAANTLTSEEKETVSECLEVIESEVAAEKPKKGMLKTAMGTLSAIKGATEFGAAVAALVQFATVFI